MASKRVRCSYCSMQMTVPPFAHAIQCAACRTVTSIHQNDPWDQAHNSISHASSRFKDLMHTASNNMNKMVVPMKQISTSGTTNFGRKRAVLCGVSYNGQAHKLNGTINDVKCMRYFLNQKHGFPSDSIIVLTEEESNPIQIPTKRNIIMALQWLVQGCQSGDSLVFYYSGHGSQQPDPNGDEVDGYDETLWPVDYQTEGKIVDDEINVTIVKPLPRGAKLHAIIDACHSGTILDLPFLCRMKSDGCYMWEDHGCHSAIYTGTSGGLAVSISSCDDHQVSFDTTALSGNTATGAMTFSFIEAAQNDPGLTYGRLLNAMRQKIREAKPGIFKKNSVSSLIKKVMGQKSPPILQVPQLSSSEKFDIHETKFIL